MEGNLYKILKDNFSFFITPLYLIILIVSGFLSPEEVLILYAFETIIIGFFHCIKIFGVSIHQKQIRNGVFTAMFFTFHYGFFCLLQTYFFFDILNFQPDISSWHFFQKFNAILSNINLRQAIAGMCFLYCIKTIQFFIKNSNINIELNILLFQPYLRIFIQQFVAVFPFFMLGFLYQKTIAAVVLTLLRTAVDFLMLIAHKNPDKLIAFLSKNEKEIYKKPEEIESFKKFVRVMFNDDYRN